MLQIDLILAAGYQGLVDGDIGSGSIRAIRSYQRKTGHASTGILSKKQTIKLSADASWVYRNLGLTSHRDDRTGFTLFMPTALLEYTQNTRLGTKYSSKSSGLEIETINLRGPRRTLHELYQSLMSMRGRHITYSTFKGNWFVITGVQQTKNFYTRFHSNGVDQRGFSIAYENYLAPKLSPAVILMSNTFAPYSSGFLDKENKREQSTPFERTEERNSSQPSTQSAEKEKPKGPSSGTGFFVSEEGHIATNAHVIDECTSMTVDGWGSPEIVEIDKKNDLAILKVKNDKAISPLPIQASGAKLGEDILALGYPLRGLLSDSSSDLSVTTGVVSTLAGLEGDRRFLTISAPVQPGNSGGPLVNRKGQVVGVVSSKLNALRIMLLTGDVPQNVNFAVKSQILIGHLLIAGVAQTGLKEADTNVKDNTAQLVASLRDSVVAIDCK